MINVGAVLAQAEIVHVFLIAIQADADQELVFMEQFGDLIGDQSTVGLNGIMGLNVRVFLHPGDESAEIARPADQGFPTLEADVGHTLPFQEFHNSFNQSVHGLFLHDPVGRHQPVLAFVKIKTVTAVQVTQG